MKRAENVRDLSVYVNNLKDNEVWEMYALTIHALKRRGLIRTKNITGERGEFLAIEVYNGTPGLPNLQAAPEGTQNVDALSRNGERYSIKTITQPNKTTGVFHGLGGPTEKVSQEKKFEHLIIVLIDRHLNSVLIIEFDWDTFIKYKKWHKTMRAWNISVTKSLLSNAKIIFEKGERDG